MLLQSIGCDPSLRLSLLMASPVTCVTWHRLPDRGLATLIGAGITEVLPSLMRLTGLLIAVREQTWAEFITPSWMTSSLALNLRSLLSWCSSLLAILAFIQLLTWWHVTSTHHILSFFITPLDHPHIWSIQHDSRFIFAIPFAQLHCWRTSFRSIFDFSLAQLIVDTHHT